MEQAPGPPPPRRGDRGRPRDAGAASGLVNVAHQVGGSLGIAILTIAFTKGAAGGNLIGRFQAAFTGAVVFFVVALALGIVVAIVTARTRESAELVAVD